MRARSPRETPADDHRPHRSGLRAVHGGVHRGVGRVAGAARLDRAAQAPLPRSDDGLRPVAAASRAAVRQERHEASCQRADGHRRRHSPSSARPPWAWRCTPWPSVGLLPGWRHAVGPGGLRREARNRRGRVSARIETPGCRGRPCHRGVRAAADRPHRRTARPGSPDPSRRYINSRLNCGSCHLATGTEPGTLTLLQTEEHYPRFSGRAGTQTDIEDRINECMTRSMNGKPLPMDSPEMMAMAAYLAVARLAVRRDGRVAQEGGGAGAVQDAGASRRPGRAQSSTARAARVSRRRRPGAAGHRRPQQGLSVPAAVGSGRSTTAPACTAC